MNSDFEMLGPAERQAWLLGFNHCLELYSIWGDGIQRIGCMQHDIRDVRAKMIKDLRELEKREEVSRGPE